MSDITDNINKKELCSFTSTKYRGLPDHVDEDLSIVTSLEMPDFVPGGPGKIIPFLDTDAKQKSKGKKNLQNLKDYRDWISSK